MTKVRLLIPTILLELLGSVSLMSYVLPTWLTKLDELSDASVEPMQI